MEEGASGTRICTSAQTASVSQKTKEAANPSITRAMIGSAVGATVIADRVKRPRKLAIAQVSDVMKVDFKVRSGV
jgi:hypothetical protein